MNDALDDPVLPALIAKVLEMRDNGDPVDYRTICAGREQLIEALRQSCEYSDDLRAAHRVAEADGHDALRGRLVSGRYRLLDRLGAGAMGVVYRAEDTELGRIVAVKVLRSLILARTEAHARFDREAQALAAVRHPSIVTIHDRGVTENGEPFLVMELLQGLPLGDLLEVAERRGERVHAAGTAWIAAAIGAPALRDQSFLRACVRWVAELAEGLHAAHEAGVVHRDVKPSNVFLQRDGQITLLDFGIATDLQNATITRDGGPLGTPAYMAPECLDVARRASPSVDVYSLTATLYHLITLRPPFRGTPSQVLSALKRVEPVPASKLRKGLTRDLQAILDKGMQKKPSARYPSALALARDLRAFLDHQPVQARPISAAQRVARRFVRSRVAVAVTVTVALLALVVLLRGVFDRAERHRLLALSDTVEHLTPNLTLVNPENRRMSNPAELAETRRLLDRAVQLDDEPSAFRVVRAMLRLDHGDLGGCIEDMRIVTETMGSDYARAVHARFQAAPATADDAWQVDLDTLPDPVTADDVLLAAYLRLRLRDFEPASTLLGDARLRDSNAAEILRQFHASHVIDQIGSASDRIGPAADLLDAVTRLEERLARKLAQTRHMASYALMMQRLYGRCNEAACEALELAPFAYTSAINAGFSDRRRARYDEALVVLEKARALRPNYYKPQWDIVYTLLDAGRLDEAEVEIESAAFDSDEDGAWRRMVLRGELAAERAYALLQDGDPAASRDQAGRSIEHFQSAQAISQVKSRTRWAMALALRDGDLRGSFRHLLSLAANSPLDSRRLRALASSMPPELGADEVDVMQRYLSALADFLSPEALSSAPGRGIR